MKLVHVKSRSALNMGQSSRIHELTRNSLQKGKQTKKKSIMTTIFLKERAGSQNKNHTIGGH